MTDRVDPPGDQGRAAACAGLGALFVLAGVAHFVRPRVFEAIVPPGLPAPGVLVAVSGAAEVAGGIGLIAGPLVGPRVRALAGGGLVALLAAVFPANVFMAREAAQFRRVAPAKVLWARLPFQPVLMLAVAWASGLVGTGGSGR